MFVENKTALLFYLVKLFLNESIHIHFWYQKYLVKCMFKILVWENVQSSRVSKSISVSPTFHTNSMRRVEV